MSAVSARSTLAAVRGDRVRALQHALYRAAKADPGRRFHTLYDKVYRKDVVARAWEQVRRNRGAAGIDNITLSMVEGYGVDRVLDELVCELKDGSYRPLPARRVFIPKSGSDERRPLSIPAVRDRIVQTALKIVLESVFEADFLGCSFGARPKRSTHDALQVLLDESWRGRRWVVETDVANCFEAIPHDKLMQAVEERVCDRKTLALVRAFLEAGVLEGGSQRRVVTGTPQGGCVSPLMANVYLHRLDRAWDHGRDGTLVRYIDDLVVMCESRQQADHALARITALLADLGLESKAAKTRIVHLTEGGEGFDFLGFHHRLVRARGRTGARRVVFLARWPSRKAAQHARDRIRELTARSRLLVPVDTVIRQVNAFLRGWAGYFRYGNSARMFDKMQTYALHRVAIFVANRHKRSRAWGWRIVAYASPDHFGLLNLGGTVLAPRPNRPWRSPNAGGERRR
ncbi:group II intron reverse transcriptase/maturase [Frankia sp. Cr1]|uniref:group II intron reverse transcriptase/maturase n=1 Tax=Frankia sp. Cr1 TaxID=3073931 RepID=UPI002AD45D8B|nr:group II intron reverse transcriptase/maturase [Frankia sp. Cr1]